MKILSPIILATAGLFWPEPTRLLGQPQNESNERLAAQADLAQAQAQAAANREVVTAEQRAAEAEAALQSPYGGALNQYTQLINDYGYPFGLASDKAGRVLIIHSGDIDSTANAELEEDLAVMSRIFDKALGQALGQDHRWGTAMGIDVLFAPGQRPIRGMYLEGYGALFVLNVNFPLFASPAKTELAKEKTPIDSTWEEAKQELYGRRLQTRVIRGPLPEYDPEKVDRLKMALLDALKNATNIRGLKADDSITVCVFGGPIGSSTRGPVLGDVPLVGALLGDTSSHAKDPLTTQEQPQRNRSATVAAAPLRSSTLTIQVKKSDVDAFAKGTKSAEEFRKTAKVSAYAGFASRDGGDFFPGGGGGYGGGGSKR